MAQDADKREVAETLREPVDLNGEYHFKVDGKGRISLPAKFRKVLSGNLMVTRELNDECVYVFETPDFSAWVTGLFVDKFNGYNSSNRLHVAMRRKLKAHAYEVEVDATGRIMLNADVREKVGIDKDVVVVGNGDHFEIWDAKRYEQVDDEIDLGQLYS